MHTPADNHHQPIVVGYVPTAEGRAAFEAALTQAQRWEAPVVLVNTAHGGAYMDSQLATDTELAELLELAATAGVSVRVHQAPRGQDPAEVVLEAVQEHDARMLVIGLRRRSPVGKLFLGSTAQSLLLNCPVPVLAVKTTS